MPLKLMLRRGSRLAFSVAALAGAIPADTALTWASARKLRHIR